MMTSNSYTTSAWRYSCNQANSLIHKECKVCGDSILPSILERVYKEEIRCQNLEYSEEEKRNVILIVITRVSLFSAPLIFRIIVWMLMLLLFLIGIFSESVCIITERKRIKGVDINMVWSKKDTVGFNICKNNDYLR